MAKQYQRTKKGAATPSDGTKLLNQRSPGFGIATQYHESKFVIKFLLQYS